MKLKHKRKVIMTCYIAVHAAFSATISARFNYHDKKTEIKDFIAKFSRIKSKLKHVVSCNGDDLTKAEYDQVLKNF